MEELIKITLEIFGVIMLTITVFGSLYLALGSVFGKIRPKTPIQKEIEEKRKEIEQLRKQKADMAELEKLKRQEEELFREIKEDK